MPTYKAEELHRITEISRKYTSSLENKDVVQLTTENAIHYARAGQCKMHTTYSLFDDEKKQLEELGYTVTQINDSSFDIAW